VRRKEKAQFGKRRQFTRGKFQVNNKKRKTKQPADTPAETPQIRAQKTTGLSSLKWVQGGD
jgi:hypothetical protein